MKKIYIILLLSMSIQLSLSMNPDSARRYTFSDFVTLFGRFSLGFAAFYGLSNCYEALVSDDNEQVTVADIFSTPSILAISGAVILYNRCYGERRIARRQPFNLLPR